MNPTSATVASPAELLQALFARYAALRSYRDYGVLRVWRPGDVPPLEMPFATLYRAPELFRFEFHYPPPTPRQPPTHYVVGSDGIHPYLYTAYPEQRPELRTFPTLARAVAAASGISCGCAHTVARLLLPAVHGMGLPDLQALEHRGFGEIGRMRCHRIGGHHPHGGDMELSIGVDGLLHRVSKRSAGLPVEEVREAIETDVAIAVADFEQP